MIPKLKPALEIEEQIKNLKIKHKLIINDTNKAKEILESVNYYRLTGYGLGLKRKGNEDEYIGGISLEHIYKLYQFDTKLRNAIIRIIEEIEIEFRTHISYYHSIKYGSEGYVDKVNFEDKNNKNKESVHQKMLDKFHEECLRQSNMPCVKHHNEKYAGHFPLWAATELFTFGNTCTFYNIMKKDDRRELAKRYYGCKPEYLYSWILSLVEVRNICAHYNRLYNFPLKQCPRLFKQDKQNMIKNNLNKLFPVILVIKHITRSSECWKQFLKDLIKLFDDNSDVIRLDFIDFPVNWKDLLKE